MSYTAIVKEEVCQKHIENENERLYEIYALLKIKDGIKTDRLELNLENSGIAKRVYTFFKEHTKLKSIVKYSVSKKLGEHRIYSIIVPYQKDFKSILEILGKIDKDKVITKNEHKLKGYLRGIFLASGYLKPPDKEYSLEFMIDSYEDALKLYDILKRIGKRVTLKEKKPKHLIYVRNSEDIMDVLVLVGAMKAFFEYEETTMIKEIKKNTIRSMNWEVANETKVIDTAERQLDIIEYIEIKLGLENLTKALQEVCLLRLENQDLSLNELAGLINITKSGIRNRFRRLEKIYNDLKEEEASPT